jgi:hypothetical protein
VDTPQEAFRHLREHLSTHHVDDVPHPLAPEIAKTRS